MKFYIIIGLKINSKFTLNFGYHLGDNTNEVSNCPSFGEGTKITVHLDMNERSCAFTVNGIKYPEVSKWKLPSKLYPIVDLYYPGRFRIQPHQTT